MIAIYDQEKELRFLPPDIERLRPLATGRIVIIRHDGEGWDIAYYKDAEQAQHVVDQIASAIERKDALYRMPSVEEVEKELNPIDKKCSNCMFDSFSQPLHKGMAYGKSLKFNASFGFPCVNCTQGSNWQPKDK